jgi:hypothetical protein
MHGILAELGIEAPFMHPERQMHGAQEHGQSQWVVDQAFAPAVGRSYEIAYGAIPYGGQTRTVIKRIRVDGPSADDWIDLDTGQPLDRELQDYAVRGFRPLDQP